MRRLLVTRAAGTGHGPAGAAQAANLPYRRLPACEGNLWFRALGMLLCGLLTGLAAQGQNKGGIKIDVPTIFGWSAPIAGEDGRPVALVSGAKATPVLGSTLVDVSEFRLETYRYAPGKITEIIAESPSGRFGGQGAESRDRLKLRSADDRFAITGVGWSWSRTTGILIVSNAVETTLRRGPVSSNQPPVLVRSGRFEYNLKTGASRFLTDCVAEDAGRARVLAGELRSRLSPSQSQPDAIVGTNGVVLELLRPGRQGRAEGAGAVYTAATATEAERVVMVGRSRWALGAVRGEADRLLLLPGEEAYSAEGSARLNLKPSASRASGRDGDAGASRSGRSIDIACTSVDARGTNVTFTGPVVARQGEALELRANGLKAVLGPDSRTQELSLIAAQATGQVQARVGSGAKSITLFGDHMAYTPAGSGTEPASIAVEGEPRWEGEGHTGKARRFVLDPDSETFRAAGEVRVRWHLAGGGTNAAPVDVSSETLRVEGERAVFGRGVEAVGARWKLSSAEAELRLSTNRTLRGFAARREVRLEYEPPLSKPATNTVALAVLRQLGEETSRELRRWEILAESLEAGLAEGTEELTELDASGGVVIRHSGLAARGARLTYAGGDGLFRLQGDASMRMVNGMEVVGMPATSLTMDPKTMRLGVEGPVRKMVLPAGVFREAGSTNTPPST